MEIITHCQKALTDWRTFSGRATRGEFWSFHAMLAVVIISLFIGYFTMLSALGIGVGNTFQEPVMAAYMALAVTLLVFLLTASVSVTIRRLHDRNLSGRWYLAYAVLSLVQSLWSELAPMTHTGIMIGAGLAATVLFASLVGFLLMCLRGTDGVNNFGNDPRRPIDLNVFA
ncbi:DUF805 domain-containing protein [Algicella marina]|uniref:DUF805 domain-containing protein n=1 Tax=Algicella marina TaxID=2683284 RepID=A0A6P1T5Z3_9RHOB|nr:DUF805 domain-containing protein [Algicella marina]QHQ37165.1 DUF805 domain-containing protein [Algicella marina]